MAIIKTQIENTNGDILYAQTSADQVLCQDSTTLEAELAALKAQLNNVVAAADAFQFKGVVNASTPLPATDYQVGWTYKVGEAGTYAGQKCEAGDMIICVADFATAAQAADWMVVQSNIDGAVTGPESAVAQHVAVFSDEMGKKIADSGFTIGKSVPADAVFTDTVYSEATTSADGLMSSEDKSKLDGVSADSEENTITVSGVTAQGGKMVAFIEAEEEIPADMNPNGIVFRKIA